MKNGLLKACSAFVFPIKKTKNGMKKILSAAFIAAFSTVASAQSGTNSPYSQYGLGVLSDQTSGFNRGMNGLGLGFHEHNQINYLNPASYSSIDSLSFIFDAGVSGQITNFEEGGTKINANNANFEYVVGGFRLAKHFGLSFGLLPFTNVGYQYSSAGRVGGADVSTTQYVNTYSGSGGLHQVYLGVGWQPVKGFSIGVNGSYLWGDYDRTVENAYTDNTINTLSKYYSASVRSYKLDFGLQYSFKVSKNDEVTIGATYGLGHKLGADAICQVRSTNAAAGIGDTVTYTVNDALEIPTTYGAGLAWIHDNRLKVGADYTLQKWSSVEYPVYSVAGGKPQYVLADGLFSDRHKVTVGGEYCADESSRSFIKRIRYRVGASYATPYLKINGQDGPKEYSVSAGFGIPIINGYNNRSILNISGQWVRQDSKMFITENTFRINIGLTFNERWFAKWKME